MHLVMMTVWFRDGYDCVGEDYSEWTFEFKGENDGAVNMFQLRGHGKDKSTRLHDIRHILMNDFEIRTNYCSI